MEGVEMGMKEVRRGRWGWREERRGDGDGRR